jgi:shikimate kinase
LKRETGDLEPETKDLRCESNFPAFGTAFFGRKNSDFHTAPHHFLSELCRMDVLNGKPVFFIGFMATGKTWWGRAAAAQLKAPFIDLDRYIEEREGRTIPELFREHGEAGFRAIERARLHELRDRGACIVATGGGAPCFFDNIDWMNRHGSTLFLDTPVELIVERLKADKTERPLLRDLDEAGLRDFVVSLLEKRGPFYRQAAHVLDQSTRDAALLGEIVARIEGFWAGAG